MTRVQIPTYTSAWMCGDRYGEIGKSGKTILVDLGDCTVLP